MNGQERRQKIMMMLTNTKEEISATEFSKMLGVSRQVIVGDIALLRATGHEIIAAPKGYLMDTSSTLYKKHQIIVKHTEDQTKDELSALVNCNVIIYDVTVSHPLYGILKGELNIKTLDDIEKFLNNKPNLLSSLTDGIHVHTLLYKDQVDLDKAIDALNNLGFIYKD